MTGRGSLHLSERLNPLVCEAYMQATVCAKFGLPCIIYMGAKDMERQALNVFRMRLLGAEVRVGTPQCMLYCSSCLSPLMSPPCGSLSCLSSC